jgi:hypothetical protein
VLAPPTFAPAPVSSPTHTRPSWLLPAVGAGLAIVVAAAVAAVLLSSGASTPAPLADQTRLVVAPVTTDVVQLASAQTGVNARSDLSGVKTAADRLKADATSARAELDAIKVRSSEQATLSLLRTAIGSAADYGQSAAAAADKPTDGSVGAARAAADSARTNFTAVSAALPSITLPPASAFNVDAIASITTAQKASKQQAAQAISGAQGYVRQIDQLLTNSSETRGNLGDLINGVTNGTITSGEAKSQIAGILNQRQSLQNSVAAIDAPAGFRTASRLLRQSLAAAITDDYDIQGWIDAWNQNDQFTFDQFWQKHLAATAAATSAKQAFVAEYNAARRRVLHNGPLKIGDNY